MHVFLMAFASTAITCEKLIVSLFIALDNKNSEQSSYLTSYLSYLR